MKKRSILMITGLALIFAAACSTESEEIDEFEVLSEYMVDNNLDLTDLLADGTWITTASAVFDGGVENYFIVDLRGSDKKPANGTVDFEDGHIPGANLVTLGNVLTYVQTNNTSELPVVVVCYSGQTAGHAVAALKLSDIPAKVLKWGMSSWNSKFDVWSGNTGSVAVGSAGWDETDDVPTLPSNTTPTLDTGHDDGADILADRVQAMLDGGFKSKAGADVLTDYASYNVINFWAVTDWELYGHVKEAYQVT
ncbi:MAG: rhodanese-like domain-containing protein, partial [Candidatus Marinimicrobia bacterium]|nr:rhodanese-like domain-containing protein [Candidatus Neomarinimicrobiota bacterium]